MDGGRLKDAVLPILIFVIVTLIGISAGRLLRDRKKRYFAACEYWVFLPDEVLPGQDGVMTYVVGNNPHGRPIGPREGILFSDVRLHVALVLRAKNPHVFRPDLFGGNVEISKETLAALPRAASLAKVRYASDVPLSDNRHLQFMPHLADAYAQLGNAVAVYDAVTEQLWTRDEFHALVGADRDAARPEMQVRIVWESTGTHSQAFSKGLIKQGMPEIISAEAQSDLEALLLTLITEAAHTIFRRGSMQDVERVACYGDTFELTLQPERDGKRVINVVRIQAT